MNLPQVAGHGVNPGHGFTKYLIIDGSGRELPAVTFPSLIARAGQAVAGSLAKVSTIPAAQADWWVGEDALRSDSPLSSLAQSRLEDPAYIPALIRSALLRFGHLNGAATGICVTGLPAAWSLDRVKATQLAQRLREAATTHYTKIRVIAEPLGPVYAQLLDNDGQLVGDEALEGGRVGVVDIGHHTVDTAIVHRMAPLADSLTTYELGTSVPLGRIRSQIISQHGGAISLFEVDRAVRRGAVRIAGQDQPLPVGWERALITAGEQIAASLVENWKGGTNLDAILIAGGGAELEPLTAIIREHFPHATVMADGQLAVARGYAKLARRLAADAV